MCDMIKCRLSRWRGSMKSVTQPQSSVCWSADITQWHQNSYKAHFTVYEFHFFLKFELILAAMLVTSYHVDNRPTTKPVHSVRGKLCQRRLKETDWKKTMTWSQGRSLSFTCSRTHGEYRHSKLHSSLSKDQTTESNSKEMQRFLISYLRLIFHFLLH